MASTSGAEQSGTGDDSEELKLIRHVEKNDCTPAQFQRFQSLYRTDGNKFKQKVFMMEYRRYTEGKKEKFFNIRRMIGLTDYNDPVLLIPKREQPTYRRKRNGQPAERPLLDRNDPNRPDRPLTDEENRLVNEIALFRRYESSIYNTIEEMKKLWSGSPALRAAVWRQEVNYFSWNTPNRNQAEWVFIREVIGRLEFPYDPGVWTARDQLQQRLARTNLAGGFDPRLEHAGAAGGSSPARGVGQSGGQGAEREGRRGDVRRRAGGPRSNTGQGESQDPASALASGQGAAVGQNEARNQALAPAEGTSAGSASSGRGQGSSQSSGHATEEARSSPNAPGQLRGLSPRLSPLRLQQRSEAEGGAAQVAREQTARERSASPRAPGSRTSSHAGSRPATPRGPRSTASSSTGHDRQQAQPSLSYPLNQLRDLNLSQH